jgi:hypothetical protein
MMRAPAIVGQTAPSLRPSAERALMAYAREGDRRAAARSLGVSLGVFNNALSKAFEQLDVVTAIDAFKAVGWLQVPR